MLLALALLAWPGAVSAAVVSGVDIDENSIVLRFDESIQRASAFMLSAPNRIAVDISDVRASRLAAAGGVVARLRVGRRDADTTRFVFDLAEPAILTGGRFAADGRSLTLSIRSVDHTIFERAATLVG